RIFSVGPSFAFVLGVTHLESAERHNGDRDMRLFKSFLAAATLLGFAAAANAVPYTWVDDIDFTPDRYITPGSPAGYTHSILDDGFNPLIDLVYDYELRIDLFDDNDDPWYAPLEIAVISQPGVIGDTIYFDLSGTEFGGWSLAGHALLALTGELSRSEE